MSGALSSLGKDKPSILTMLENAKANISTFGIALTPCSLPGSKANFSLADDEMELGLGVHGENGIGRTKVSFFTRNLKQITVSNNCSCSFFLALLSPRCGLKDPGQAAG